MDLPEEGEENSTGLNNLTEECEVDSYPDSSSSDSEDSEMGAVKLEDLVKAMSG